MKNINVDQLMSRDIFTVSPYDTLASVSKIFQDTGIHHLPVLFEGDLVGIISNTDLERAVQGRTLFKNHDLDQHNDTLKQITMVSSVMTKKVKTIDSKCTIKKAYEIFKKETYRSLVVVEDEKLVGILTPMDFLDYFFKNNF